VQIRPVFAPSVRLAREIGFGDLTAIGPDDRFKQVGKSERRHDFKAALSIPAYAYGGGCGGKCGDGVDRRYIGFDEVAELARIPQVNASLVFDVDPDR
jgi:hypothetical protein